MNIRKILTPLLIILLLLSIVVMGAPTYVNVGPTTDFEGDVGVPDGSGYYINDILFSTLGLIDISTLAKTDGGIIVGDGTNFVLETGATVRASLGLTIGTHVQAYDAGLLSLAGLTYASDSFIKVTAEDVYAMRTIAETKTDLSLNYVENLKVKLDATEAPDADNDVDEGYTVGSRWFDVTNDKEYVCLDNTDGAAVWTETTGAGGGASTFLGLTDTPATYTDQAGEYVKVNAGEDGLEFDTPAGVGTVVTSGTPVIYDYARFTNATTIEGRSYSELKTDLAYQLSDMSDVGSTTPTDKYALMADGESWESRALVEADISDLGTYLENIINESIGDLSDVDLTDIANEKILQYNSTSGNWECEDAGAGGGETNTASNVGSQIEIYKQKTGVDLEFRTLKADSNKILVTTVTVGGEIDIGPPAVNGSYETSGFTTVNKANPANQTGTIVSIEVWAFSSFTNFEVATFYVESGDNLSTRDTEYIGSVTSGSKQTFEVNLNVQAGDYIGCCGTTGSIERSSAGSNIWYLSGDNIPCTNATFSVQSGYDVSLYGTGVTTPLDYIRFDIEEENIRLDDLKATEDNADLDTSTTAHGLMPKLPFSGDLLSTTTVAFNADADTTLYTVPTGKRCVLSHAIVVAAGDAGATTTVSIGANGSETDFIPANTLSNLDVEYDSVILMPIPNTTPLKIKSYAAATVIEAQVASQSGAAGNTIYLFGITY